MHQTLFQYHREKVLNLRLKHVLIVGWITYSDDDSVVHESSDVLLDRGELFTRGESIIGLLSLVPSVPGGV